MAAHILTVGHLTKEFVTASGPVLAVDNVSFELSGAEFFTMLGPSGCGKTTTLRMIAGLEACTSGTICFDGQDFSGFSAFRRNIGMVFQSYALFPHMTVFDNTAYGLRIRKVRRGVIEEKVTRILDLLGLRALAGRYPADLSGGQQQRVSIARALVYDPGMLLLDEPLANLDAKLRVEMREEIRRIQKELEIMSVYVTHDQEEAMSVSDRLGVFNHGRLMQAGKPHEVYANPTSLFVADFIGKANFFPARTLNRNGPGARVALENGAEIEVQRLNALIPDEAALVPSGFDGMVMVRPEHLELGPPRRGQIDCVVRRVQHLGSFIRCVAGCRGAARDAIVEARQADSGVEEGAAASLRIPPHEARFYFRGNSR